MAGRLFFTAFVLLTAIYGLLAYLPFTFHQIVQGGLLPWLSTFAVYHPLLFWLVLGILAAALLSEDRGRRPVWLFLAVHGVAAVLLTVRPVLAHASNGTSSLLLAAGSLVSILWLAALEWSTCYREVEWPEATERALPRLMHPAWQSALLLAFAYAGVVWIRELVLRKSAPVARLQIAELVRSLDAHLVVFAGAFAGAVLLCLLSGLFRRSGLWEFLLFAGAAIAAVSQVLARVIFPTVSFEGTLAQAFAVWVAFALVVFWTALSARLAATGAWASTGLELLLLPLVFWFGNQRWPRRVVMAVGLPVLLLAAYLVTVNAAAMDWNYVAQKSSALMLWLITFAVIYRLSPEGVASARTVPLLLLGALAVLGCHKVLLASEGHLLAAMAAGSREIRDSEERYAALNPSYQLLRDMLAKPRVDSGYYQFLNRNTNISRAVRVDPAEVRLTSSIRPASAPPLPNIFLFVVDSMRRDYLSPYNERVTFTPSIARFARESTVMRNAFTRYGGTGLSEPSIWSGSMLVHKQYVTPFHPMNSLEKLLDGLGYTKYISVDTILRAILEADPDTVELDRGVQNMNYDFGRSLKDLAGKLEQADGHRPVFAYTQPQNLHISVINRASRSVPAKESYPGFDAPYASRMCRVDQAFGDFIQFLKQRGLYDNSIVILTADHGDSLGEDGRWGHAYSLYPEVLRIPLLIHLPDRMRAGLWVDPRSVVFSTDITPSLYYLLGQRPIANNELYGRPLFTASAAEQNPYRRDDLLVASSYAPVYGILHRGRELYVSDAVHYREYLFNLDESGSGSGDSSPAVQARYRELIRSGIGAVHRFYHFAGVDQEYARK